ncbi:MAG: 16S rRNA (uracil(1498)-N(3))-methyltransferase [Myxococcota bacterium]|nr:16S rRNA (uracil(1498)-N(3))-methyltransferase [Myxococcota bacterium]
MRVFVDPSVLAAGELVVRGDEHHYLSHVRRARVGDVVELVDGSGRRATATITAIAHNATTLTVGAPEAIESKPPFVRALIPLIKGDRMDTCLEKLVEVGVDEIVVWAAARAVVRLDADRRESRLAKFVAMVQAAARQSGRAQVPTVQIVDDAIAGLTSTSMRILLDPASDARIAPGDVREITVASGPEGGFTVDELDAFTRAGFAPVGLGPRILRAETAPVVAVALIRALTHS